MEYINYIYPFTYYPTPSQRKWLMWTFRCHKKIYNDLLTHELRRKRDGAPATPSFLLSTIAKSYVLRPGFCGGDKEGYGEVAYSLQKAFERHEKPPFLEVENPPYVYIVRNDGNCITHSGTHIVLPYLGELKIAGLHPLPFGVEILKVRLSLTKTGEFKAFIAFRKKKHQTVPALPYQRLAKAKGGAISQAKE